VKSENLAVFLRDGVIPPIDKGDSKQFVIRKLGAPDDWKGRIDDIGWNEPLIEDFQETRHWHYGSVVVSFAEDCVSDMSIWYDGKLDSVEIKEAFGDFPKTCPILADLISFMERERIGFVCPEGIDACILTDGGVSIGCRNGIGSENSPVLGICAR
jgi:hypothetical protein